MTLDKLGLVCIILGFICMLGALTILVMLRREHKKKFTEGKFHEFGKVVSVTYPYLEGSKMEVQCYGKYAYLPPGAKVYYKEGFDG